MTTNYDLLYEEAVAATGQSISVLPWQVPDPENPWILKLHGDVDHPRSIVLTRRHMVRYDAENRPSVALLESLLLTRHLLIVGSTMTDDNVIRILHEVSAYREAFQTKSTRRTVGTFLDTDKNVNRQRLWESELEWSALPHENFDFQLLEIFLDNVALHATSNASWLLDGRFADLLDDADMPEKSRETAADAQRLRDRIRTGKGWEPLRKALDTLGTHDRS